MSKENDEYEKLLHAKTLCLGDVDPDSAEPKQTEPKQDTVAPASSLEPELKAGFKRPKVMESLCQVTPKEQVEQTKSKRQLKKEGKGKKKGKKGRKGAKAKARRTALQSKRSRSKRFAKAKAKASAKRRLKVSDGEDGAICAHLPKQSRCKAADDQAGSSIAKGKREAPPKRKAHAAEPKKNTKQNSKKSDKAEASKPTKSKKEVDPEIKKARSRKASAYHKAKKEALAKGLSNEEAKEEARKVPYVLLIMFFLFDALCFFVGGKIKHCELFLLFQGLCGDFVSKSWIALLEG